MAIMSPQVPPTVAWPHDLPPERSGGGGDRNPRSFRPDIEGLRAIAVVLVVLYHGHLLNVTGGYIGVDVFFVLSGFLITRQLVANIGRRGHRELPAFYARRIRRLLPASTAVVLTTVLATHVWAPALQAKTVATDAIFTIFYGLNYRLAINGTDYMHQGDAVSPMQHFWSLGVEEQFYLAWPLIIVVVLLLPRAVRHWALLVALLAITFVSFHQSATSTVSQPAWAYFSITTRAWELGAGALIALSANAWTRLPRWPANVVACAGLAALVGSAWMLNDSTPYPGVLAAIPVLATAVIVGCGCASRRHAVERVLAEPLLQGIGKISYSWYLWHWPFLIIAPMIAGEALEWPRRAEVILLSLLVAVLSYHVIENPVRRLARPNVHWLRIGAVLGCAVAGTSVISSNTIETAGHGVAAHSVKLDVSSPGLAGRMAKLMSASVTIRRVPSNLTPTLSAAQSDVAASWRAGCLGEFTDPIEQPPCVYGDASAKHTVVMFGDSHMEQWSAGVDVAAKSAHWKLIVWTRSACPAAKVTIYAPSLKRTYTECDQWRAATAEKIEKLKPDLVLMSQSDNAPGPDLPNSQWADGMTATIGGFTGAGIPVTFIMDTPFPGIDMPACVANHLDNVSKCVVPRAAAYKYAARRSVGASAAKDAGARVVDPTRWLCGRTACPVVVSNVLVYRDTGHISATYARWLAPVLTSLLQAPGSKTGG